MPHETSSAARVKWGVSKTLLYLLGYCLLILGLALGADLLGVPTPWVVVGVVVLAGSGLMSVSRRFKD